MAGICPAVSSSCNLITLRTKSWSNLRKRKDFSLTYHELWKYLSNQARTQEQLLSKVEQNTRVAHDVTRQPKR